MRLGGTFDIPCDCNSGGRTSSYSYTRECSPDDGNCFRVLVMCKTHVNLETVMDAAPIVWCRGGIKAAFRGRE